MYASGASFRALPVSDRVSALCSQLAIIFAIIALSSTSWFIHKGDMKRVQLSTVPFKLSMDSNGQQNQVLFSVIVLEQVQT